MDRWKKGRSTRWLVILLIMLALPALRAGDSAYFINPDGSVFGTIDLNTGAVTMLGKSSIPHYGIAGLGEVGSDLYTAPYPGSTLYKVNPASGALNPVGTSSIQYWGLGSTTTGLYALALEGGSFSLYSVNPTTAATTLIGPLGPGIAQYYAWTLSTGSSALYLADNQNLYSIDTNTGAATLIGGTNNIPGALVYENGKLYAGVDTCNPACNYSVWTLSAISGAGTFVADITGASSAFAGTFAGLAPIAPPVTQQILPQFAFGGGWYSALYFTNAGAGAVSFQVNFFADNGTPLIVPSINGSSTTVNLAPQATAIIEAPDLGSLSQGYASVALPDSVTGYGLFRQSAPGIAAQEAVVLLSSANANNSTLIWDDTNFITSVAIANPSAVPVTVSITLWDTFGNIIGTSSVPLSPGTKTERALRNLSGLAAMVGQRGSAKFTVTSGSIAVMGLRFNGSAFSSIPTAHQ